RVSLSNADESRVMMTLVSQGSKCNCDPKVGPTGILCIGSQTLETVSGSKDVCDAHSSGHVHLACAAAPGSKTESWAATYEVSLHRISDWAVRLMIELRSGDRPIEVIVPGFVRAASWQREGQAMPATNRTLSAPEILADIAI